MLSLEYVAGFFDGEGCVNITVRGKNRQVALRVMVVNTERSILEAFHVQFGGMLPPPRPHKARQWKAFNMWSITGRGAAQFLESIHPYVRVKKAQVELALEFGAFQSQGRMKRCEVVWTETGHATSVRTPDTIAKELDYKQRMHDLNRKGAIQ